MTDDMDVLRHRDANAEYFGEAMKRTATCESCGSDDDVQPWTDGALVLDLCERCRERGRRDEEMIVHDG